MGKRFKKRFREMSCCRKVSTDSDTEEQPTPVEKPPVTKVEVMPGDHPKMGEFIKKMEEFEIDLTQSANELFAQLEHHIRMHMHILRGSTTQQEKVKNLRPDLSKPAEDIFLDKQMRSKADDVTHVQDESVSFRVQQELWKLKIPKKEVQTVVGGHASKVKPAVARDINDCEGSVRSPTIRSTIKMGTTSLGYHSHASIGSMYSRPAPSPKGETISSLDRASRPHMAASRVEMTSIASNTDYLVDRRETSQVEMVDRSVQVSDMSTTVELNASLSRPLPVHGNDVDKEINKPNERRMYGGFGDEKIGVDNKVAQFDRNKIWNLTPFELYCQRMSAPIPVAAKVGNQPYNLLSLRQAYRGRLSKYKPTDPTMLSSVKPNGISGVPECTTPEPGIKHATGPTTDANNCNVTGSVPSSHVLKLGEVFDNESDSSCAEFIKVLQLRKLCRNMFFDGTTPYPNEHSSCSSKLSPLATAYTYVAQQRLESGTRGPEETLTSVQSLRRMCRHHLLGEARMTKQESNRNINNHAGILAETRQAAGNKTRVVCEGTGQATADIKIDLGQGPYTSFNLVNGQEAENGQLNGHFGKVLSPAVQKKPGELNMKERTYSHTVTADILPFTKRIPRIADAPTIDVTLPKPRVMVNLGDLMERFSHSGLFREAHAQFLSINILRGLAKLRSQGVVHANVFPRRILLNVQGYPELMLPKAVLGPKIPPRIEYSSPEEITSGPITMATAVFQTGSLMYTLLYGRSPYKASTFKEAKQNLLNPRFTPEFGSGTLSKDGRQFIRKCIRRDPDLRFKLPKCRKTLETTVKWFGEFEGEDLANQTYPSPFEDLLARNAKDGLMLDLLRYI